jgi:hypothetical protein
MSAGSPIINNFPNYATFYNLGDIYGSMIPALNDSYANLTSQIEQANADPSNPVNVLNAQAAISQFTLVLTMASQMMAAYKQTTSQIMQNIR